MFDIMLASSPGTWFTGRVASSLRDARMRVFTCEVAPARPPPSALRVDAAVVCAPTGATMLDVARSVRGALDGPPPVVGISGGPAVSAPGELAHVLPEDVSGPALVAQVQRAAARAERRRSRVLLSGDLDDVGLDALLASLSSRSRTCFVRLRDAGGRRAEITLTRGHPIHVRADGIDATRDRVAALQALGTWTGATFEVVADDASNAAPAPRIESARPKASAPASSSSPTSTPPASSPPSSSSASPSSLGGSARDVALAAAVVNACAAYARTFLGAERATAVLTESWSALRRERPSLDAFVVTRDGMVTVAQVERAKAAIPDAVAVWMGSLFEGAAVHDPTHFRRVHLRDVLGGLTRLVEQVGWANVLLEGERAKTVGASNV